MGSGQGSMASGHRAERIIRRLRGATARRPEDCLRSVRLEGARVVGPCFCPACRAGVEWWCRSCGAPVVPGQGICGSVIECPNFVVYDHDVGEDAWAEYQPMVCRTTIGEFVQEYTTTQVWDLRRWKLAKVAERRALPDDLALAAAKAAKGKSRSRIKAFLTECLEVLRHIAENQPPAEPKRRDAVQDHPLLKAARSRKALPRTCPWSEGTLKRLAKGK